MVVIECFGYELKAIHLRRDKKCRLDERSATRHVLCICCKISVRASLPEVAVIISASTILKEICKALILAGISSTTRIFCLTIPSPILVLARNSIFQPIQINHLKVLTSSKMRYFSFWRRYWFDRHVLT